MAGYKVIGVDINPKLIENLNNGILNISEPGLDEALKLSIARNNFMATLNPISCDVYLIAVPTPFKNIKQDVPQPNIDHVMSAANAISKVIKKNQMILIESTCPIGTTRKVAHLIKKNSGLKDNEFSIAYCPERVLPGNILYELKNNDRVVGSSSSFDSAKAKNFYLSFCNGEIFETNSETAELVKLTENSFRDVNIAFANELSIICDSLNIDVSKLIKLANHHPRVNILKPGAGVGGHCIAVDPWFIVSAFPEHAKLIKTAREVNNFKTDWIIKKIIKYSEELENKKGHQIKIGCMGLSFKPDVNDMRESPSLKIYNELSKIENKEVLACDPNIKNNEELKIYSIKETLQKCDLFIFLVSHSEFKKINLKNLDFLDFCNITYFLE